MNDTTGGFIWYELMTSDADAATAFYSSVVGWTISGEQAEKPNGVDYRHVTRSDGGSNAGILQLTDEMREHGARPGWYGYIHVANVDAAVDAILADGGTVLLPKMTIDVGSFATITDPEGVPFYVMAPIPPADNPHGKSDAFDPVKAEHVRWNELMANDAAAALTFYQKHFGWGQEGELDMGPMGKYRFIQQGGTTIGAVMPKPPQAPMPVWTYYIGVDDIDRAASAIAAGGGRIAHGPMEIPGGEFSLSGIDPQGAAFGLVGPRKG